MFGDDIVYLYEYLSLLGSVHSQRTCPQSLSKQQQSLSKQQQSLSTQQQSLSKQQQSLSKQQQSLSKQHYRYIMSEWVEVENETTLVLMPHTVPGNSSNCESLISSAQIPSSSATLPLQSCSTHIASYTPQQWNLPPSSPSVLSAVGLHQHCTYLFTLVWEAVVTESKAYGREGHRYSPWELSGTEHTGAALSLPWLYPSCSC